MGRCVAPRMRLYRLDVRRSMMSLKASVSAKAACFPLMPDDRLLLFNYTVKMLDSQCIAFPSSHPKFAWDTITLP